MTLAATGWNHLWYSIEKTVGEQNMIFVPAAVLVVGVWGIAILKERRRKAAQGSSSHQPAKTVSLLAQLCSAHGLGFRQRSYLRQLAESVQLDPPILFVDPRPLTSAAENDETAQELLRLLFGKPTGDAEEMTESNDAKSDAGSADESEPNDDSPADEFDDLEGPLFDANELAEESHSTV